MSPNVSIAWVRFARPTAQTLALLVASVVGFREVAAERIETLDGRVLSGALSTIVDGRVQGEGLPSDLKWDAVRRVTRTDAASPTAPITLKLRGGAEAACASVSLAQESLTVNASGIELSLPLNAAAAVLLARPDKHPALSEALDNPARDADRLVVVGADGPVTLNALAIGLNSEAIRFQIDGEERSLPRDKLLGIVFAQFGSTAAALSRVTLVDGSTFPGTLDRMADGQIGWRFGAKHASTIPWVKIASIENSSNKLTFLSDLRPANVVEETVVALPRPWKADASVLGLPLRLGTATYTKGLGVHARCELTFDIPIGAKTFLATIGLDADAGAQGECGFRVKLDGREVFGKLMRKSDPPAPVQVDLRGAKRITLVVDPGEGLDDGDLANWADARFLKTGR